MAKNRVMVRGYTRSDGVKVKSHSKRGPGSETYGTGTRWNKKNKVLTRSKPRRR